MHAAQGQTTACASAPQGSSAAESRLRSSRAYSSRQAMAHPLFTPEARLMLKENDASGMQNFCETLHPATVAESLTDGFSVDELWRLLGSAKIKAQAAIFEYLP